MNHFLPSMVYETVAQFRAYCSCGSPHDHNGSI